MSSRFVARVSAVSAGLLIASSVLAKPATHRIETTNARSGATFSFPAHAVERAPDVFSLGTAIHEGIEVEGMMFVHRKNNAKPSGAGGGKGGGGNGEDPASSCYSFLASGAKWKTKESWVLNPTNVYGLTDALLLSTTAAAINEWEAAAGVDIMGEGSLTTATLVADETSPDNKNEIYFGTIDDPNVIAVTITWGIFGGNPRNRQLIEMDQVYDQADFSWSMNGELSAMDYENIAQHEIGHGLGMGHTPTTTACAGETMYPTASNGETAKRDLGSGDIAGISALY